MPAPYIREIEKGGIWCVMYKNAFPAHTGDQEYLRCGIVAAFVSQHTAEIYAQRNAAYIRHLEEVTTP